LSFGVQELAERGRRLAEERVETADLLYGFARDLHTDSTLLRWVEVPALTNRMLGLPSDVRACLFAVEGVLTTSADLHAAAWRETLDAFLLEHAERNHRQFLPFDRHHDYADYILGKPRITGVHDFLASRGISLAEGTADDAPGTPTVHGLANSKKQALQRRLDREGVAAFEGSRCYLEGARIAGLRRAVVSASTNTVPILERAGLAHLIEGRVDGHTLETQRLQPKPAPDMLLEACSQLRIDPSQAAAFETTPAGIAAARRAGVKVVIGVNRNGDDNALRASDVDLVVSDLIALLDGGVAAS